MGCSNCFNGCADIISDKCVKYTGNDFNLLGMSILTGDSLLMVEQDILSMLSLINSGTGVVPAINYGAMCSALTTLLPDGVDSDLNEVLDALSSVVCGLVVDVATLETAISTLNDVYTVGCLAPISPSAGTHAILQAVINKVCELEVELDALTLELHNNYVTISELPTLIQDFIDNSPTTSLVNNKMIPFVAYPFFGDPTGKFDGTGAGIGDWTKVYMCNGISHPSVPDLRGRTLVGATTMGPPPFSSVVDPAIPGNPIYSMTGVNAEQGANSVILGITHMPNHTHIASVTITDPGHEHNVYIQDRDTIDGGAGTDGKIVNFPPVSMSQATKTTKVTTGISAVASNDFQGGGNAHSNIQPSRATIYIMYIP